MELYKAIMRKDANAIIELINQGAALTLTDDDDSTPLHLAAQNGFTEIIGLLLDCGADINEDEFEETPLYEAVRFGQIETVQFLLENGANIEAKGMFLTPLYLAVHNGQTRNSKNSA